MTLLQPILKHYAVSGRKGKSRLSGKIGKEFCNYCEIITFSAKRLRDMNWPANLSKVPR